ncbi:LrgB family protein [candidate division KSB1 bacterium]|nr:LrgB family protein [candidate division KSB1 bacterium]
MQSIFNPQMLALVTSPLLWLTLTVVIFQLAAWLFQRLRFFPLLNPVLVSILSMIGILLATRTPYATYFAGAQFIHFLLGPATVALAIPLYEYLDKLKQTFVPMTIALMVGSLTAIFSVMLMAKCFGITKVTLLSLIPKSVTTPIAMGIAEKIGGIPALTAVLVILTGITGAVTGEGWLDFWRIRDHSIRGFAIGLASHGIGTARAFQMHPAAGAFAGLGMGLNGALTAFLVPLIIWLCGW